MARFSALVSSNHLCRRRVISSAVLFSGAGGSFSPVALALTPRATTGGFDAECANLLSESYISNAGRNMHRAASNSEVDVPGLALALSPPPLSCGMGGKSGSGGPPQAVSGTGRVR